MELPSVVHPRKIDIDGYIFEVVSYAPLTDEQAARVAMMYYQRMKKRKKDRGKVVFRAVTLFDENSSELL